MADIFCLKYSEMEILKKREYIYCCLRKNIRGFSEDNINEIGCTDMEYMFTLYDEVFLGDYISKVYKGKIKFSISGRMTKSAGLTICPKTIGKIKQEDITIEIKFSRIILSNCYSTEGEKRVGGVKARDTTEAMMLVFEHELCHFIEFIEYGNSNCKAARFKELSKNLFYHKESYHSLPTSEKMALNTLGIKLGDTVGFVYRGNNISGVLYKINKRAVVMVRDDGGRYTDKKMNRYSKYYVPADKLEVIN